MLQKFQKVLKDKIEKSLNQINEDNTKNNPSLNDSDNKIVERIQVKMDEIPKFVKKHSSTFFQLSKGIIISSS